MCVPGKGTGGRGKEGAEREGRGIPLKVKVSRIDTAYN